MTSSNDDMQDAVGRLINRLGANTVIGSGSGRHCQRFTCDVDDGEIRCTVEGVGVEQCP